jgi:hypothetical protein
VTTTAGESTAAPTRPAAVDGLAKAVVALLALTIVVDIWSTFAELHRASLMSRFDANQNSVTFSAVTGADHQVRASAISGAVLLLVTGIVFISWLYRTVKRLQPARPDAFRQRPGWAIGSWFVPILNLVRPKQIVDDTYSATRGRDELQLGVPATFHFWWGAWLIANFVTWIGVRWPSGTPSQLATADRIGAVGDVIDIVAAALAMVVVLAIARRVDLVSATPVYVGNYTFNPPPGWPTPPAGWVPPAGWQPDPSWPPAPADWTFWVPRG